MWLTLRAMALVCFVCVCGHAQTRTLAVYSESARDLGTDTLSTMRAEVQRLLAPAGLNVIWKQTSARRSGEDFELVVVASFQGTCSTGNEKVQRAAASLADTSISDGRILPFFRVDCGRLIQLLGERQDASDVGRALGRVIAHEIYHIVANTTEHHDTGVAKATFSTRDLTNPRFEFDAWSLARMQPASVARVAGGAQETGR
jgi:hypothetical protein